MNISLPLDKVIKIQKFINKLIEIYDPEHLGSLMTEIGLKNINPNKIFEPELSKELEILEALKNMKVMIDYIEDDPDFEIDKDVIYNALDEEDLNTGC